MLGIIAALALGLVAPVVAAATTSHRRPTTGQYRLLMGERDRLRRAVKRSDALAASRFATIVYLKQSAAETQSALDAAMGQLVLLTSQVTQLTADKADAIAQRDNALRGLPDAIKAVPLDQFFTTVIYPARAVWPCDTYYENAGYISVEFESRNYC